MEITARHWLIASLIAGLTHAALALALVQVPTPAVERPLGITIALGPAGGATSGEGVTSGTGAAIEASGATGAEGLRALDAAETDVLATAPDESETLEAFEATPPAPPKPAIVAPVSTRPARTAHQPIAEARADTSTRGLAEIERRIEEAPEPSPAPRPKARPEAKSKPAPRRDQQHLAKRTPARTDSARHGTASGDAASDRRPSMGSDSGADERIAGRAPGAGSGNGSGDNSGDASGGGSGAAGASDYYARLSAWLGRHKRYPSRAQNLRQEGTVKVSFTIDRNGRVVSKRIVQSSGHSLLDREAEDMLERASPMPRIPAELKRVRLTLTLPVAFNLR